MDKSMPALPLAYFLRLILLVAVMAAIGSFTAFAAANTYEVISGNDIPISNVVRTVPLTSNQGFDSKLRQDLNTSFEVGDFGVPAKIKFPETKQHIDIMPATNNSDGWLARAGNAQSFLTAAPRQKVFGEAVIYLRTHTLTTEHLGDILNDDIINIVTDSGWQLGYQVDKLGTDPVPLMQNDASNSSTIIIVEINDKTTEMSVARASLVKVGERV